jgi:hypothetical protein
MVKSAPASPFTMSEPQLSLEFFVVALDYPTLFGQAHQFPELGFSRQRG